MCSFKLIYFVIFILNLYKTNAQISDKRLCFDPDCKEPVSLAKALLRYNSPDARILSFGPNADIKIYSKEAGSETHLWGAEINGKRGYVPKHLVREYKVLKIPKLLVDTELKQHSQVPISVNKENVRPDNVQEPFEVVDGTTIYINPQDGIQPSSTENPILSTAVPPGSSEVKNNAETSNSEKTAIEKGITEKEIQESVVENVLSTFSNWISDDSNSEELEEFEDDDDEDEEGDEDDEDEENLEEIAASQENLQNPLNNSDTEKPVDINSLHSLPLGVKVSTYKLELKQSVKESIPENVEKKSEEQKPKTETLESHPLKSQEVNLVPEIKQPVEGQTSPKINTIQSEKKISSQKEMHGEMTPDPVGIETVTETSFVEEEPLPILDEVTPDPLEVKTEELLKTKEAPIKENSLPAGASPEQKLTVEEPIPHIQHADSVPISTEASPSETDEVALPNANIEKLESKTLEPVRQAPASVIDSTSVQSDQSQNPVVEEKNEAQNLVLNEKIEQGGKSIDQLENVNSEKVEIIVDEVVQGEIANEEFTNQENFPMNGTDQDLKSEKKIVKVAEEESTNEKNILEPILENEISTDSNEEVKNDTVNTKVSEEDDINIDDDSKKDSSLNIGKGGADIAIAEKELLYDDVEVSEIEGDALEIFAEDSSLKESHGIFSNLPSSVKSDFTEDDSQNMGTPFSSEQEIANEVEETLIVDVKQLEETQEGVNSVLDQCDIDAELCLPNHEQSPKEKGLLESFDLNFNSDVFLYLITTAISVILFLFGYMALDRNKREAPLIAKINKLEKQLLITLKENELLQENDSSTLAQEAAPNEIVEQLTRRLGEMQLVKQALEGRVEELKTELQSKEGLEEQIENLEKELETSTEVGMELNRIISEMLNPTNGSERLKENVEQLQRQLLEQRDTINTINESLHDKEEENKILHVELESNTRKAAELQIKLNEIKEQILKIEKEKDDQQNILQNEIAVYQQKYREAIGREDVLTNDFQVLRVQLSDVQRQAEIKTREYQSLKESLDKIKSMRNDSNALRSLLDATAIKAELQQLRVENERYVQQLENEQQLKGSYEKKYEAAVEEVNVIKQKYEQADKEKVEVNSKLDVLNNYFKKRETELQEEVIKYKSIWNAKEGEATSTTERIRYMQEEIENYKAQNEALKQEIISQEIELKSQISMLEKKVHENWVAARQSDRKLEDARQEAAQLRNRLTLRERAIHEERTHNRLQSPVEQNGELPLSPHPIDSPASPPLLYGRDHITKSPPLSGLPPFLPPPPGVPFMPPPLHHGMPPFLPPPPSMFPGDHRPPPLGRMSSPPLNSRYSPDTSAFSPYDDHNSRSSPYDSDYGLSPPPIRGYSPYSRDERRDYKRPPHVRSNGRNMKDSRMSSGSEHSNDSVDKTSRKQSKMV